MLSCLLRRTARREVAPFRSWEYIGPATQTSLQRSFSTTRFYHFRWRAGNEASIPRISLCGLGSDFDNVQNPFFQHKRWKRKDGNRYHMEERPATKKQLKRHNRKLRDKQAQLDKHSKPGSKAGERREWERQIKEDILNPLPEPSQEELEKYTLNDALLDDLIGNTSEAQPTPEPTYIGHKHGKLFQRVANQMSDYRKEMELLASGSSTALTGKDLLEMQQVQLPSDWDLSLVLRAFRDKEGTRQKPVGIVKALKHLLQDIGVPLTCLGENIYTTLLTCSKSPAEGRRIIQMMKQEQHPISAYSWSILVDVYSKAGDYKGCLKVHTEMIEKGIAPTLASFTSLFAACYKVCADGRVSHQIRADAAKVAWEQWQEMRIVGIAADVMAYGAILRIMAATGKPERALNILEEMQYLKIAPTTLCFTSALRSISRSHATAIRYEHGSTRRNLRREQITAHHGKLAQAIVRMAENAEVEQDDGFISALISCAAAAGDLATAKAIFVANQIRRLDQFRTIGSDDHLARLRGEGTHTGLGMIEQGGTSDIVPTMVPASQMEKHEMSFGEREYGKDSRVLSAIMQACANAAGPNMVGSMWQGRENEGYLCENSLRLICARKLPQYADKSIPGAGRTDNLTWEADEKDRHYRGNKRQSSKSSGIVEDDSVAMTLDELDDTFSRYFVDKEGERKPEYRKATLADIWNKRYGLRSGINDAYGTPEWALERAQQRALPSHEANEPKNAPMHFNSDTMRWEEGPPQIDVAKTKKTSFPSGNLAANSPLPSEKVPMTEEELFFDPGSLRWKTRPKTERTNVVDLRKDQKESYHRMFKKNDEKPQELFFDADERKWKQVDDGNHQTSISTTSGATVQVQDSKAQRLDDNDFASFFADLKRDVLASGVDPSDIDEAEARELFASIQEEDELMALVEEDEQSEMHWKRASSNDSVVATTTSPNIPLGASPMATEAKKQSTNVFEFENGFDDYEETNELLSQEEIDNLAAEFDSGDSMQDYETYSDETVESFEDIVDPDLEELRALLPAFSDHRLRKVQRAFAKNLGDPSILDLVKIARENMPDYVTNTWLKQMSILTARYVMKQAIHDGLLDIHMLNGVLQLETSAGRLDRALDFHQTQFVSNNFEPTVYSDRLVLQMFLENNRFTRALSFKELVERDGRCLDLQSYGSLIDYCAKRKQVGSAMLLLKECHERHNGAQPGHAHLAQLRIAYRQAKDLHEKDLEALIGPDPIQWLKHGERHLKREMSKKGRRDVRLIQNASVRI